MIIHLPPPLQDKAFCEELVDTLSPRCPACLPLSLSQSTLGRSSPCGSASTEAQHLKVERRIERHCLCLKPTGCAVLSLKVLTVLALLCRAPT